MAELDAAQRAAVDAGPVDLFISAGAGAGKTSVLTARFVAAVLGSPPYDPCDPVRLLTVTYTDKAAAELSERIRRELASAGRHDAARRVGDAWISTIHGMCSRVLRQYALDVGVDPRFGVLDQAAASVLEAEALDSAIRELLDDDPAAAALFDEFTFATVTAAARDVRASVCALGLGSDAVVTVSPEEAVGGLLPAATALLETASAMDGLRACTRVRNNAAAARRVADTIAAAVREGAPAAMAAALSGVSREGLHRDVRIEGLDELVDRAHDHVDEAERCAAQLRVAPFEETFLALVSRFERTYAVMKRDRGMLDFEDLQVMTARLLESRPDVAAEFRGRFAMVMIDEFQDANALQLRIAESLAAGNLCTVGDENQSIYGFRHADVEVFRQRARRIERHQPLHTNYRIDPRLLAGLSAVFAHPALLGSAFVAHPWPEWSPPVPVGGSVYAGAPFELRFVDFSEVTGPARKLCEAGHIADRVEELVGEGVQPNDIAVLLRRLASGRALAVERALRARGVPATLNSGGAFFECAEVVESRALLRAIDNVLDDRALVSVLAGRFVGLRDDALFTIRQHAERRAETLGLGRRDTHLWPALERAACELEPADAAALARIVGVIHQARKNRGARSLETILLDALHELDADLVWFAGGASGACAWANVLKLARWGREYESTVGGGIAGFLASIDAREAHGADEQEAVPGGEASAVRIMSVHAAKGLEFRAVVVGGLAGPRVPDSIALGRVDGRPVLGTKLKRGEKTVHTCGSAIVARVKGQADAEESVRLLYVACTRAKESLTIVAATDPDKEADDAPAGLLRRAVGMGGPGAVERGTRDLGGGQVRVGLLASGADDDAAVVGDAAPAQGAAPDGASGEPVHATCPPADARPPSGAPRRVSYSALSTYRDCPYRFFLTAIAGSAPVPTERAAVASAFGSAVHAVLERCGSVRADTRPLLAPAAAAAGLDTTEMPRLERVVGTFLASATAAAAFSMPTVMHEVPICVPVAGTTLAGAVDLFARDGDRALVVDYKTGSAVLTEGGARERFRLQGECYALAALAAGARGVRVVFAELERGRETTFEYTAEDRAAIEATIAELVGRISAREFPSLSRYVEALCESCPGLGGMCPVERA